MQELFAVEAAAIAGPKGKHVEGRTHHWGTAKTRLPFGGRNVVVDRPRVRRAGKGGGEIPSVEVFRAADPLCARVAEQIVLGVSTRGYEPSLEPVPDETTSRGTSKSSASRALIKVVGESLTERRFLKLTAGYQVAILDGAPRLNDIAPSRRRAS